jgi:hypothetical protein
MEQEQPTSPVHTKKKKSTKKEKKKKKKKTKLLAPSKPSARYFCLCKELCECKGLDYKWEEPSNELPDKDLEMMTGEALIEAMNGTEGLTFSGLNITSPVKFFEVKEVRKDRAYDFRGTTFQDEIYFHESASSEQSNTLEIEATTVKYGTVPKTCCFDQPEGRERCKCNKIGWRFERTTFNGPVHLVRCLELDPHSNATG